MKRRLVMISVIMCALCGAMTGCIHEKIKFQKAMLLDPMMDPAKTEGFYRSLLSEPASMVEHGSGTMGEAVGGTCPTCGG